MNMGRITRVFVVGLVKRTLDDVIVTRDPSLVIFRGDGDSVWYQPRYFDHTLKPIGKIHKIIPYAPDVPEQLLDSVITFAPKFFESCPSLEIVQEKLKNKHFLNFGNLKSIPKEWTDLKFEAISLLGKKLELDEEKVGVFSTELKPISFS